jgi:hypothetical protein
MDLCQAAQVSKRTIDSTCGGATVKLASTDVASVARLYCLGTLSVMGNCPPPT